ncbi:exo-alpha-sialidase [Duganella sp. FT80W]|uniref:Exo-alpha-sialidase n=1 Tax=Duganella guangzhouensis TaxID=2666084 RepID=A0A6I2L014_9BURK|nr:sialidase family protein [Duganella guangzhouensis]MRW91441.1 exo-alpha-sialidase [Duganella guangzhouensis]
MNNRYGRFAVAALCASLALNLNGCGGSGVIASSGSGGTTATTPVANAGTRGTLIADAFGAYPRLVRQSHHASAALNGRVLASMQSTESGQSVGAIYASGDDGLSYSRIGTIADPDFKGGHCCAALYELPVKIGALPAGTLLYAASVGQERTAPMENRIYQSADGGVTWNYLSLCGKGRIAKNSKDPSGIWEPEFAIAASGELMCYYSDETLAGHSQILVEVSSGDGVNWSAPRTIVAGDDPNARPGMAIVRRLPSGAYLMTYENCYAGPLDCALRAKRSADGIDWGAANDPGFRLETASGQFFRHAPTFTWAPVAGQPNGMLIAIGQILFDKNGVPDAGNGKTMFTNTSADGSGAWAAVASPLAIAAPPSVTNWCQNYSSPLLPSADGKRLLMLQTDGGADQSCRTRYGSAALTP